MQFWIRVKKDILPNLEKWFHSINFQTLVQLENDSDPGDVELELETCYYGPTQNTDSN